MVTNKMGRESTSFIPVVHSRYIVVLLSKGGTGRRMDRRGLSRSCVGYKIEQERILPA